MTWADWFPSAAVWGELLAVAAGWSNTGVGAGVGVTLLGIPSMKVGIAGLAEPWAACNKHGIIFWNYAFSYV